MSLVLRTVVVAVVLSLALTAMVARKQYTLNTGTIVLLETRPIDPRSLFRGDYVRLNYAISTLNPGELDGDDAFERGDIIYVVLQPTDKYWQPVAVHAERPVVGGRRVVIRGRVRRVPSGRLRVKYGIESYFVPEGTGRALERPARGRMVDLRIAVDRFGNAGIKAVLVDGEVRYRETLL